MKTLKFTPHLVRLIVKGEKTCTWRVFDEKNLAKGDEVVFIDKETGERFGTAHILEVYTKTFGTLTNEDYIGHEGFDSEADMYSTYRSYYPDGDVNPDTEVKILRFKFTPPSA